jgi:WXXGXW repeat (2 copies)
MVKKVALAVLFALTFCPVASMAQLVIRVGPPAPVYERRGPPPERGYVWVDGYHRYQGDHYEWVPGRYDRPPHEGARWSRHHWVHRHGQWVMVEGHWR